MTTAITQETGISATQLEQILVEGNLEKLTPAQRLDLYTSTCKSLGLNPLTKPFAYIRLNGKLTLYALKETTDQLRKIHGISIKITAKEMFEESYVVTAVASDANGRTDESTGAVPLTGLRGDAHANALMKAETKAKRRVTLSFAGLGMLDETETDTIVDAQSNVVNIETGEFIEPVQPTPRATPPPPAKSPEVIDVPPIDQDEDFAPLADEDFCTEDGHNNARFELRHNPSTGVEKWVHQYKRIKEDGTEITAWCVKPD